MCVGLVWFFETESLCVVLPGCVGSHSVDQASLELRNLPASASQVLGLKACAITARLDLFMYEYNVAAFRHTRRGHQISFTDGCEPPYGCWDLNSGP